ncbi:Peptidoglycan-associated lipoprotein [Commensalibacter sp. Nvir]|uniref:OmpA family protein n=1 Tax=Commensalibacter sp. Nvir TaxID=3069817 RepID=UPI002D426ED1|nr:Peptidoglycan-associated lipoprotein [Commensalibacter sp. Nvir]
MRRILPTIFVASLLFGCAQHSNLTATNDRTYVVFFPFASTKLDDPAQTTISQAANYAKHFPAKHVYVKGYAAIYGDMSIDESLAKNRAEVVSKQIIDKGIDSNRVHDSPRPPEDRKNQLAARRVEIEVK